MSDILKVSYTPSSSTTIYPSKEIHEHAHKLGNINDLRFKLQYYNQHICSLSYSFQEGLYLFGSYDLFHGFGEFFLKKGNNQKSDPDFEIYLEVRQNEIIRLKNLLESKNSYAEKLQCFIEDKAGQIRFNELKVRSNEYEKFLANGAGTVPAHLLGNNYLINLEPRTPEQIKEWNKYLHSYVQRLIANSKTFYKLIERLYEGFIFSKAEPAFELQLSKALRKDDAIATKKKEIEKQFFLGNVLNYIDLLYPYKISNLLEWQAALFNAFVNGFDYDFSRRMLTIEEVKGFYHVEQVFEFYKYLIAPKKAIDIDNIEGLLTYLKNSGEVIRPKTIAFNEDGTQKITSWSIGKTIEEKYKEKVEQIDKVVMDFKVRCYSNPENNELNLLKLQLNEMITFYKDENIVFKDSPVWQKKIEQQFEKAAERLTAFLNIISQKIEFRKNREIKPKQSHPTAENKENVELNTNFGLEYIKADLHNYLPTIEAKMENKIEQWKICLDKIECAAFCELLYEKKYFHPISTRIKTVNQFALSRYGNDISIQLQAAKKKDRSTHKIKLLKFFK